MANLCLLSRKAFVMCYYKIAKIVRALWLAEGRVCMRVCKHSCDVKMFCFSRANHVSTNLKKFLTSKLDKVTLFTHSFVGWNLENLYKQAVSTFFQILSEKNPYFGKHLFAKQELITRARLRVQDFGTGKNFCFNQYHNKEFLSFFSVKLFYKSNRKLFLFSCANKNFLFRRLSNDCQIVRPALVSGPPNRKKPYNKHLNSLVFSVRTVNYGSSFLSIDLWPARLALGPLFDGKKTRSVIYSTDRKLG